LEPLVDGSRRAKSQNDDEAGDTDPDSTAPDQDKVGRQVRTTNVDLDCIEVFLLVILGSIT
jgi:hypothetical protein